MKKKMEKRILSDLEKMNVERKRAWKEYEKNYVKQRELDRLMDEGIKNFDELVFYIRETIKAANNLNLAARNSDNKLLYVESTAVRREFKILLNLILVGEEKEEEEKEDGMEVR
ncbi:hypothetical protein DRN58_09260 [Thermococci archaeon]|nr:MAG: hypothetical protein DRN58_09260 [Thermococci archaeon]